MLLLPSDVWANTQFLCLSDWCVQEDEVTEHAAVAPLDGVPDAPHLHLHAVTTNVDACSGLGVVARLGLHHCGWLGE